jgi:DNA-binding phage protein
MIFKGSTMPTRDYASLLDESLADPNEASAYLNACLDEGPAEFLLGLLDVARARGELERASDVLGVATDPNASPSILAGAHPFAVVNDLAQSLGVRLSCSPVR